MRVTLGLLVFFGSLLLQIGCFQLQMSQNVLANGSEITVDIKSRDEEIDYAEAHNVPLKINRETNYSKDKNLWHLSHEGLDLEDTGNERNHNGANYRLYETLPQ